MKTLLEAIPNRAGDASPALVPGQR